MQNVLREIGQLESTSSLIIKKAVHTRWLSHKDTLQTVRKLYVLIVRDLENAVVEGRDTKIKDGSGIQAGSLLKMMKTYSSIFLIHLLCDVYSCLSSLIRLFERNDVDLSIVEPKIQAAVSGLQKMKVKDGPYLTKSMTIANELFVEETDLTGTKNKFLEELNDQTESRLKNTEIITHLSALNLSQIPPDATTFHGDQ